MNVRDWTAVTDVDGGSKIQDFDGNTLAVASSKEVADLIVKLVELLDEAQPAILYQLEMSTKLT